MKRAIILIIAMLIVLTTGIETKAYWTEESKEQIESNYEWWMTSLYEDNLIIDGNYEIQFFDNDTYLINYEVLWYNEDYTTGKNIVNKDGRIIKRTEFCNGKVVYFDLIDYSQDNMSCR